MSHFTVFVSIPNCDDDFSPEIQAESHVAAAMEPFCESTEDPDYLKFKDITDELKTCYISEKIDCFKLPGGSIVPQYHPQVSGFVIKDGKVYQNNSGPLKHAKRTKKAKRIKALPNYSLNKLYLAFESYAEDYYGYSHDTDRKAYGFYHNPQAFWDWYQIGGRWPFAFLVKDNCLCVIEGERSWATENDKQPEPAGYKWVAGARKMDIEWELMKTRAAEAAKKRFSKLCEWFYAGDIPQNEALLSITEDGIMSWGDVVYKKDETLAQYLERNSLAPDCKYPIDTYGFIENGGYISCGDMGWWAVSTNKKPEDEWRALLQSFIARIPEDDYIVSVDCHI